MLEEIVTKYHVAHNATRVQIQDSIYILNLILNVCSNIRKILIVKFLWLLRYHILKVNVKSLFTDDRNATNVAKSIK
jgi:hypothetical protein